MTTKPMSKRLSADPDGGDDDSIDIDGRDAGGDDANDCEFATMIHLLL